MFLTGRIKGCECTSTSLPSRINKKETHTHTHCTSSILVYSSSSISVEVDGILMKGVKDLIKCGRLIGYFFLAKCAP